VCESHYLPQRRFSEQQVASVNTCLLSRYAASLSESRPAGVKNQSWTSPGSLQSPRSLDNRTRVPQNLESTGKRPGTVNREPANTLDPASGQEHCHKTEFPAVKAELNTVVVKVRFEKLVLRSANSTSDDVTRVGTKLLGGLQSRIEPWLLRNRIACQISRAGGRCHYSKMNRGNGRAIQRRTSRAIGSHLQTVGWISRQKNFSATGRREGLVTASRAAFILRFHYLHFVIIEFSEVCWS
jgi:hypothetical protein